MICARRWPDTHAKVDLPVWRHIKVNRGKELLLLIMKAIEAPQSSVRSVVFQTARNHARKVIADFDVRRKFNAFGNTRTMKRPLQCRIKCEIPAPDLFIYNRAYLPCPCIG